ncbi:hypothetical protein MMC30_000195 [Trapelia coarctata]|nr:hypothetical protein [Trapelia coarctata]
MVGKAQKKQDPEPEKLMDTQSSPKSNGANASNDPKSTTTKVSTIPSKRKAESHDPTPSKAPRRSARSAPPRVTDPTKLLNFLLSPSALPLSRPKDESEALKADNPTQKTYASSTFTPFEELVSAVILSRPISHTLGVRSIRTLLNAPYDFTTPKAIREAGPEGRREALDKARTQHRQKTADELGAFADSVVERLGAGEDDVGLERVRREAERKVGKEREILQRNVKGLGRTGLDIFFQRIQGAWEEAYPFVHRRTADALHKLGLPSSADDLRELLEEKWSELKSDDVTGSNDETKKRKAFVRVLERAVGADLEGNIDDISKKVVEM